MVTRWTRYVEIRLICTSVYLPFNNVTLLYNVLTHWGWVMYVCGSRQTIIGSDNGLLPVRHQAIIWTTAGILLIEPLQTNFIGIFIGIHTFSLKKMHLKMSSGKWQPFCLSLNGLTFSYTFWYMENFMKIRVLIMLIWYLTSYMLSRIITLALQQSIVCMVLLCTYLVCQFRQLQQH